MKRFLVALTLTCALSGSALAGDIPTCGAPAPAPSGITQTTSATSPGETVGSAQQISDAALSVLLTVLGLLAV